MESPEFVVNAVLAKEKASIRLDPPAMTQLAYNVTAWLEALESPKLLIPLTEAIAQLHVPVFSQHFRDVVDMEIEQGGPVRAKCEEVVGGLGLFWRDELGFTLNDMLVQFLRDAELYAKEADEDAIRTTRLMFESMGLAGGSVEAFQERLLLPFAADEDSCEDSDSLWASVDAGTPLSLAVALGDWRSRLGHGDEGHRFDFDLRLSRGLRKGRNFGASDRLLPRYLPDSGTPDKPWATELNSAWRLGIGAQSESWRWLPLARHAANLLCPATPSREGFGLLCDALSRSVEPGTGSVESLLSATTTRFAHLGLRNELSRGILCLSIRLGEAPELGEILLMGENFIKLVEKQLSITENFLGALDSGSIVGALLTLAASLCPELSKAQRSFADWAHNAGRKAVEGWSGEELGQARAALPADAATGDLDALVTIISSLRSAHNLVKSEAAVCVAVQSSVVGISASSASALGGVWAQANRSLFLFYESAAAAAACFD